MVGGQSAQIQTMQQMLNGQLVMVQNPAVGVTNPNYVDAQQPVVPQTIQYTTQTQVQTVQAVQQPVTRQDDLPPSYDKALES